MEAKRCLLMEADDLNKMKSGFRKNFKVIETLFSSRYDDLHLCACNECGQLFLEVAKDDGMDNYWNWWVPVSEDDVKRVKEAKVKVFDLINTRKHIFWDSDHEIYILDGKKLQSMKKEELSIPPYTITMPLRSK